jgi:CheY-like chemotaxis protein
MRVLIADDDRDTVLTLGILLRSEGYDVRLAQNGTEALSLAEAFRPDVALLDLHLPGRSGLQVAQELGRRSTPCPFLIAIGGHFGPEERRLAEISGFNHLMAKPFDRQALLLLLDSIGKP